MIKYSLLFTFSLWIPSYVWGREDIDDFEFLLDKLVHKSNNSIEKELNLYDNQACVFKDIDYADTSRVYWQPIRHLERINRFTEVYINPEHVYYHSSKVYNAIVNGLKYWCRNNFKCRNWWFNEIAVPQQIGLILVNLRSLKTNKFPVDLENKLITKMKDSVSNQSFFTGANRTDIVIHRIYRSCLMKNEYDLQKAVNLFFEPLDYSKSEGITIDNCYFQHGKQLYIGGYAIRFLDSTTKMACLFLGTKYAPSRKKLNVLCKFARETFFSSIKGQTFSYNVVGRNISRKGALKDTLRIIPIAQRLIVLDSCHKEKYRDIINSIRGEKIPICKKPSHIYYYYSDYTLYTCPSYTFDIRCSSTRTQKCETLNDENLKGYLISEGSQCLMINGDEYDGVFPVWSWTRIPGTTSPQVLSIPSVTSGAKGSSNIVGGVSDSICGVTAFNVSDTLLSLHAKKSWFVFDKEIVCLGSDICSKSDYPVETSVNQCLNLDSQSITYSVNGNTHNIVSDIDTLLKKPKWVLFGNVGYFFPEGQNVILSNKYQTGSWNQINKAYSNSPTKKRIFYLGINHAKKPYKERYSYIIIPCMKDERNIESCVNSSGIKIVSHSSSVHAVYDSQTDLLQIVFWEAGDFLYKGIKVTVNQPCGVMLRGCFKRKRPVLHISKISNNSEQLILFWTTQKVHKKIEVDNCIINGETQRIIL